MEKKVMGTSALALGLVMVLVLSANSVHAITCNEAITTLMPCLYFLKTSGAPKPPAACCVGVAKVNSEASTTEVRKVLCECFKKAAPAMGVIPEKAKQLPDLCGVKVSVPMDPSIDCSSIHF